MGTNGPSSSSEEQRRKWREKGRLQRARKKAGLPGHSGLAASGEALPASAPAPSAVLPGSGAPAPVPWNPERLRKLWEQLVPSVEKWDVESLKKDAAKVDPSLVDMVAREAPWNPVSKTTLIETGPNVTADLLNSMGIGAERGDLVAFAMASWCIYSGRAAVAGKLEEMLAAKEDAEKGRKTPNSKPQTPNRNESD